MSRRVNSSDSRRHNRAVIHGILRSQGDQTDAEIAANVRWIYLPQSAQEIRLSRQELVQAGLIFEVGERDGQSLWSARRPRSRITPYRGEA